MLRPTAMMCRVYYTATTLPCRRRTKRINVSPNGWITARRCATAKGRCTTTGKNIPKTPFLAQERRVEGQTTQKTAGNTRPTKLNSAKESPTKDRTLKINSLRNRLTALKLSPIPNKNAIKNKNVNKNKNANANAKANANANTNANKNKNTALQTIASLNCYSVLANDTGDFVTPWKLDSAASDHYAGKQTGVRNRKPVTNGIHVGVANGESMHQIETGTIPFNQLPTTYSFFVKFFFI